MRPDPDAGRPRPHRLTPRFSDAELEDIKIAATLAGMTPTGYTAKCAADAAALRLRPPPAAMLEALGELLQTRYQLQKFSTLVNQATAKWHATDQLPAELTRAVELVNKILPRIEEAAAAVRETNGGGPRRAKPAASRHPRAATTPPRSPRAGNRPADPGSGADNRAEQHGADPGPVAGVGT